MIKFVVSLIKSWCETALNRTPRMLKASHRADTETAYFFIIMFKYYITLVTNNSAIEKTVFADYFLIDETGQKLFYLGKKILIAVAPSSALVVKAQ